MFLFVFLFIKLYFALLYNNINSCNDFLVPSELYSNNKIGYISIKYQTITIPADVSKNRKEQAVALNDTILKLMIEN